MSQRRVAFVIPWFGDAISGGAESLCRDMSKLLNEQGVEVEILTTCAKDFRSDWAVNFHSPGVSSWKGMTVRRYALNPRNAKAFDEVNGFFMRGLEVTPEQQKVFNDEMIHSESLVAFCRENRAQYIFCPIPYMFGTSFDVALACPEETVMIPCLHDEPYARMQIFEKVFTEIRGALFNTPSELKLAEDLYFGGRRSPRLCYAGMAVKEIHVGTGQNFVEKFKVTEPYLLYAGRKESGKGVETLVANHVQLLASNPDAPALIFIGPGDLAIPQEWNTKIFDLGFVGIQDKFNAMEGALALVQPSLNESFSIVMMEAWQNQTPCLVDGRCGVTRDHVLSSSGGLFFDSPEEYKLCVEWLAAHPEQRKLMGRAGQCYVRENFSADKVFAHYMKAFQSLGFSVARSAPRHPTPELT